jgi:hypothetical protein
MVNAPHATVSMPSSSASYYVDAPLKELTEGPYLVLASYMDAHDLCQIDASCTELKAFNSMLDLWRSLGARVYTGIDLECEGTFEPTATCSTICWKTQSACTAIDWKRRFGQFKQGIFEFRCPFKGNKIMEVKNPDAVVYCRCKLCTEIPALKEAPEAEVSSKGVYIEVEVLANADNLSLVIVDFDHGERSSVTFSPDTGAVIRETKTQEEPQRVDGAYIQPLQSLSLRFVGRMGLYMQNGHIAFFRKYEKQDSGDEQSHSWETTGFIMDVSWAEGRKLTPCLAFRDEGSYEVRIHQVASQPPIWPSKMLGAYNPGNWTVLNWDASAVDPS